MDEYQTSGHAILDVKHHLIWVTKYRYKILRGEVAERALDVIR
jgi:putative transposase